MSECVGVQFVGYAVMLYGLGNAVGSFGSGKLLEMGLKLTTTLVNFKLHLTLMLLLIFWEREPILIVLLFISSVWGICDGVWITVYSSKFYNAFL